MVLFAIILLVLAGHFAQVRRDLSPRRPERPARKIRRRFAGAMATRRRLETRRRQRAKLAERGVRDVKGPY